MPVISLQHALADQEPPAGTASRMPDSRQSKRPKAELFTLIRRDAREHGLSARALADKYGAGKRIVRQHERLFLARVSQARRPVLDVAGMHSSDGIAAWQWWTAEEIDATDEVIWPANLADLVRSLR